MKTSKLVSLAALLGCLILSSTAFAQTDVPPPGLEDTANDGLLSHTYLKMDAKVLRFRDTTFPAPTGVGGDMKLNISAADFLDVGFGYDVAHARNCAWRYMDHKGSLYGTGFHKFNHFAPFVSAGLGYSWQTTQLYETRGYYDPSVNAAQHMNTGIYSVGAGVEITVFENTSVRLAADREESMRRPHPNDWVYQTMLNYNFNDVVGMGLGMDYEEGKKGGQSALIYHMGVHFLFD